MHPALKLVSDNSFGHGSSASNGQAPKPGNGAHRKPTILIVEDEVLIRMAVCEHVRDEGFRVLEASNVAEAQAILRAREPIEIVFSDVNMPGAMNGIDLAQWVRDQYPDVRIILASGQVVPGDDVKELGPFLRKPYSHDVLMTHIKRLLMR